MQSIDTDGRTTARGSNQPVLVSWFREGEASAEPVAILIGSAGASPAQSEFTIA